MNSLKLLLKSLKLKFKKIDSDIQQNSDNYFLLDKKIKKNQDSINGLNYEYLQQKFSNLINYFMIDDISSGTENQNYLNYLFNFSGLQMIYKDDTCITFDDFASNYVDWTFDSYFTFTQPGGKGEIFIIGSTAFINGEGILGTGENKDIEFTEWRNNKNNFSPYRINKGNLETFLYVNYIGYIIIKGFQQITPGTTFNSSAVYITNGIYDKLFELQSYNFNECGASNLLFSTSFGFIDSSIEGIFKNNNFKKFVYPRINFIPSYTFENCFHLEQLYITNATNIIHSAAFNHCTLKKLYIEVNSGGSLTILDNAFDQQCLNSLTDIYINVSKENWDNFNIPLNLKVELEKKIHFNTNLNQIDSIWFKSKEGYVSKVTNNYTDEDKEKLQNLQNYDDTQVKELIKNLDSNKADKTEIPTRVSQLENDSNYLTQHQDISTKQDILVSGTNIKTINNNSLLGEGNLSIPTPTKTSQLTNDSNFITTAVDNLTNYYLKTNTYSKEEVNNLINAIKSFNIEVVESLPIVMKEATIYLVPSGQSEENNFYNEYIYVNNKVELIGNTKVDISGKQDKLTAGIGIEIGTDNTISVLADNEITKVSNGIASSQAVYTALQSKAGKVNTVTFENGAELTLADNTEYYGTSVLNLTLNYPQENFECYISFDIPTEGTINISLDQSKYIGILPNFTNGKSYEISIKNGVVICGEVIK